jgi:signal transduction histidine kinase/CheY-like chemotaxis protein
MSASPSGWPWPALVTGAALAAAAVALGGAPGAVAVALAGGALLGAARRPRPPAALEPAPAKALAVAPDESTRLAEELAQVHHELRRLRAIDAAIAASSDVGTVLQRVLDGVTEFVPDSQAAVFLAGEQPEQLRLARVSASAERPVAAAAELVGAPPDQWTLDVGRVSPAQTALRGHQAVISHDFEGALGHCLTADRARQVLPYLTRIFDFASCAALPLEHGAERLGLLVIGSRQMLSGEDLGHVTAFATQAAVALARVRHERCRAEQQAALEHAYDQLAQTRDAAIEIERMRALGEMTSGIAHNFNNALTAIMGSCQLVLNAEPLSESARARLDVIDRTAADAARLVQRLRAFSRDDILDPRPADLNQLVREAAAMTEPRWRYESASRGTPIDLRLDLTAGRECQADPTAVKEVVVNLIHNAVNAMPDGGRLELSTWDDDRWVYAAVRDTGCGLSEEVARRCFEPFFTTRADAGGTGLGLSVAYGLIQRHGGDISAHSAPGGGAEFVFQLPALASAVRPEAEPRPTPAVILPFSPLHALVVDDQGLVRQTLGDMLGELGHRSTLAASAGEALSLFDPAVHGLVITDLEMPDMSGIDLAQAVKARSPRTPVLLLTGHDPASANLGPAGAAINGRLGKPLGIDDLALALEHVGRG